MKNMMNKPTTHSKNVFWCVASMIVLGGILCLSTANIYAIEADQAQIILWNVQEKSGQIEPMTDENGDGVSTIVMRVLQGQYTYRVAIGPNKNPIYGAEGKKMGKPIKLGLQDNRVVTFSYDPNTHLISAEVGDPFLPPKQVVLVGNLQDEFGHAGGEYGGEWDPTAETTRMEEMGNGFFKISGTLPAGNYEYKVAIGGSWKENYGQGGKQDGPNIVIKVEEDQEISFYYNDISHKIADSIWYTMLPEEELPRIIGNMQEAAGEELVLRDDDFDQVYSLAVPLVKGDYSYQVALGADNAPVYGKKCGAGRRSGRTQYRRRSGCAGAFRCQEQTELF